MKFFPALDLMHGKAVRLEAGRRMSATIFHENPIQIIPALTSDGADRLHVVDLDGAFGEPRQLQLLQTIIRNSPIPVQVGGGIRDEDTVQHLLNAGVQYVIVGTKAVTAPHFLHDLCIEYPRHIIVSIDAKDGRVALNGWAKVTGHDAIEAAQHCERDGAEAIVYTDIAKDGMMNGFNVDATRNLAKAVKTPVFASGGVSSAADLAALKGLEADGVAGCIVGRALYEGTLTVKDALKALA